MTANVNTVAILGGMGPFAGADLLSKFLSACIDEIIARGGNVNDQAFPAHYLSQWPHPDRTKALLAGKPEQDLVLSSLSQSVSALQTLDVRAIAIACNTAHAWHQELAGRHAGVELLHIAEVTARAACRLDGRPVGLLATEGTYRSRLYSPFFECQGLVCIEPDDAESTLLMQGIYRGVKAGNMALGRRCLSEVVVRMRDRTGVDKFAMACTEIPLALSGFPFERGVVLIDPAVELGAALAKRAYASR